MVPSTDGDGTQEIDDIDQSTEPENVAGEKAAWRPAVGDEVVVHPDSDAETTGRILDDFGEFTAAAVEVNETTIARAARRWAVLTAEGDLVFADTDQIRLDE